MSRFRASAASPALLGAALAAVSFGAAAGTQLARSALVELLLVLVAGVAVAVALLWAPAGRFHGGLTLALLALFSAVSAFSVLWSITPETSFVEAGRAIAYVCVFAAAIGAARLAPRASGVLLEGIALAAFAVVAYALAARIWPGTLAEQELSVRLSQPFAYWNALGAVAAMLVPAALWLGSRRASSPGFTALAYPMLGFAVLAMLLSQSRGALVAAVAGAALWFALVPLRMRSLPVLVLPVLGGGAVAAWALSRDAFTQSFATLEEKQAVAGEFGLLVALLAAVLLLAGLAVRAATLRALVPLRVRRGAGVAALAVVCLVPLALFTSVAVSERGVGGTIGDRVDQLTSETAAQPPQGAGRLTASSSSRASYWRQAASVFEDRPLVGTGAGSFRLARLRYRKDELVAGHAHGFVPQTLADLGIVGLVASLALLAAWLVAAARSTGIVPRLRRRPTGREWTAERVSVFTLALVALVFGLQSLVDWTWFIPGVAILALVAAGFVAGRGPVGVMGAGPTPRAALAGGGPPVAFAGLTLPRPDRPRMAAAAAVLVTTLLCAWTIWQPQRSERASDRALDLIQAGDLAGAGAKAERAAKLNPLSPRPLTVKASVQSAAGRPRAALRTLERAVLRHPGEPRTWIRLAGFQLQRLDRPADALRTLQGALYLDPKSKTGRQMFLDARVRQREQLLRRTR